MQKIIHGKLYDTETANAITSDTFSETYGAIYVTETLYRKKTGEYFLYRDMAEDEDEDMVAVFNYRRGGCFQPLSYKGAKTWMEHHADVDDYIKEFGWPEE